jgi:putative SOS response-associated peptidase YedK
MCGRFVMVAKPEQLQTQFSLDQTPDIPVRYNIAPTQQAGVILNQQPRVMAMLHWGLIPSWAKDDTMASKMINARSETAEEKPSFRTAFKKRRCIVPASGFFEWKSGEKRKIPFYIYPEDGEMMALAGLWEVWHDAQGAERPTFTVLTTEANPFMRGFHERMPVMLPRDAYDLWLSEDAPADALRELMRPADAAWMPLTAHEVAPLVNKPVNDSPACIEPVVSQAPPMLF